MNLFRALPLPLPGLSAIAIAAVAQIGYAQTPVLYYNFETGTPTNNAVIDNIVGPIDGNLRFGTAGGSVSFPTGPTVSGGPLGRVLQLTPNADGDANLAAPHVDTNFTSLALGITPSAAYTAMAWVNFSSVVGDNMIFGQVQLPAPTDQVLHHGSRNGNFHSGHWADDLGPDQGVNISASTGTWRHVAFTNNAAGLQRMFVNGAEVAMGANGTAGQMQTAVEVAIGTSGNAGSFSGQVDEIKVFNVELTAAQIQQAAVIPEPASATLIAMGGLGMAFLLRRRSRV